MLSIYKTLTSFIHPLIGKTVIDHIMWQAPLLAIARHPTHYQTECRDRPKIPGVSGSAETESYVFWSQTLCFFYSPQCPCEWAVIWPQAGTCIIGNYCSISLSYMLPFWKLPFHFQVPFICLPAPRGHGVENVWVGASVRIFHKVSPRKQGRTTAKLRFQRFFKKKRKKSSMNDGNEIWVVRLYLMSNKGRSEMVLTVSVGS